MRILFVSPFYKPYLGGVERVMENLSAEFIKQGHEVAVLTTKYSFPRTYHADWLADEIVDGVHVFRLESYPHKALPFYQAPLTWFSPLQVRQIVKTYIARTLLDRAHARRECEHTNVVSHDICSPEVVIYMTDKWFWGNFLVWLFTATLRSTGSIRQIWCPVFHDLTPAKFWLRGINWLFGHMINDVVVVSQVEAEKVGRAYGVQSAKIKVIPWGVSPVGAGLVPARTTAELRLPTRGSPTVTILSVGRLSRHKGQKWLVDRFLAVTAKTNVPCRLVLVGEVEEPEVLGEIRAMGDIGVLIDTAADDEKLAEYYRGADIFALFPEYESFGLVFLEAMSYGVPVLTHDVGAIKEVLGEAAIVVDAYDAEAATSALLYLIEGQSKAPPGPGSRRPGQKFKGKFLINDVAYRKELGLKGQKYVTEKYSWKSTAEQFLQLITA